MNKKQIGIGFIILMLVFSGLIGIIYSDGADVGVSLEVGNTAPNITSINLNSTTHIDDIYHTSTLECNLIFEDDNGDNCTIDFFYYKNEVLQGAYNTTMTEQINGTLIYANITVPSSQLTIGDNWSCGAIINDSSEIDTLNATNKTVENGILVDFLNVTPNPPTTANNMYCRYRILYPNDPTYSFTVYSYYQKNISDVLTWLYSHNSTDLALHNIIRNSDTYVPFTELELGGNYRCYINISDGNKSYAEYSTWGTAITGGSGGGGGGETPPEEEPEEDEEQEEEPVIEEPIEEPIEQPEEDNEVINNIDDTIYTPIYNELYDDKLWLEEKFGKENLVVFIMIFTFLFLFLLVLLLTDKKRKESTFFKALLSIILGIILFLLLVIEKEVFGAYIITLIMIIMFVVGLLCLTLPRLKWGALTIGTFFLGLLIFGNEILVGILKGVLLGGI